MGDAADGIPGIPAWGAKSSATVLSRYHHIEHIPLQLEAWDVKVRGAKRLHQNLIDQRDNALLYRQLTRLRTDVPLSETLAALQWKAPAEHFANFCNHLGVPRLTSRIPIKE